MMAAPARLAQSTAFHERGSRGSARAVGLVVALACTIHCAIPARAQPSERVDAAVTSTDDVLDAWALEEGGRIHDAGATDAAVDAGVFDAGALDAGALDAGAVEAGLLDAGLGAPVVDASASENTAPPADSGEGKGGCSGRSSWASGWEASDCGASARGA
jgi:hypothetical protein